MDNSEIGAIQLGGLSLVSLLRLKHLFLQAASEARDGGDEGAEEFLTAMAGVVETARERGVTALFSSPPGGLN